MKGYLQLENGMTFEGEMFGYMEENVVAEIVFNTSMTGYQEIITDPSYYGQVVVLTYPLIGNYGINFDYEQSKSAKVSGVIVKEYCESPSNFNNEMTLGAYLKNEKIPALSGIDTRMLTKVIRDSGVMRGVITKSRMPKTVLEEKVSMFDNSMAVKNVSTKSIYKIEGIGKHVVIIDYGIKNNILEIFKAKGFHITVVPYDTKAEEILSLKPDVLFLSNGPGDPKDMIESVLEVKKCIGSVPILGICLGHQIASLALGGDTKKLKFGHRGGNHPVKNLENNKVFITSQNHGYVVSDLPKGVEVTHINLNDESVEGMKCKSKNIFTVQFHPEACPGPYEAAHIFDEFIEQIIMGGEKTHA